MINNTAHFFSQSISLNAGILGFEVYFPKMYVSQSALEKHDGVSEGKYTIGLGQDKMAFVDEDREDINSMMMNAVSNLIDKYEIDPKEIGRLCIGTETVLDKAKSIKTALMQLPYFYDNDCNTDIEGIDTINACYGGTEQIFNSCYWLEATRNMPNAKKYAIVICGDIAEYEKGPARPTGGAGIVAMVLGRDSTFELDLTGKGSHFENAYDFYKPNPCSPFPTVDGHYSNLCYIKALDICYQRMIEKKGGSENWDLSKFGSTILHAPYNKLVQKSLGRIVHNDSILKGKKNGKFELPNYLDKSKCDKKELEKIDQFLQIPLEETYSNNKCQKSFFKISQQEYNRTIQDSLLLPKELGNCYTSSMYNALVSVIYNQGKNISDKPILMFSYGSGLASTAFTLTPNKNIKGKFSIENIQKVLDLENRLKNRIEIEPELYHNQLDENLKNYTKNNYKSNTDISYLDKNTYYLDSIDDWWRRTYIRKQ